MREKRYKLLPSYNAIWLLSLLAAIMVTSAFVYFSITFFQSEKTIPRPAHIYKTDKDALRVLIASGLGPDSKTPLEVDLLYYLSKKLGKEVVPVQRTTAKGVEDVFAQGEFDIAFASLRAYNKAEKDNRIEALVIPVLSNKQLPQIPISVRKNIDKDEEHQLQQIFLEMQNDSKGRQVLSAWGIEEFIKPSNQDN